MVNTPRRISRRRGKNRFSFFQALLPSLSHSLISNTIARFSKMKRPLNAAENGVHATALKKWKPLAERGAAPAQYNLGLIYYKGQGTLQDYDAAFKWLELAAKQGLTRAQYSLGLMYYQGNEAIQNYIRAHMWLSIVAFHGSEEAIKNRDKVEEMMTPAQLETAQKLTREWMEKNGK